MIIALLVVIGLLVILKVSKDSRKRERETYNKQYQSFKQRKAWIVEEIEIVSIKVIPKAVR